MSRPGMKVLGVDADLEQALKELRRRTGRRHHGRILLTLDVLDGVVCGHRFEEEELSERDFERIMTERPRRTL